jgi:uncharacterized membrane protein YdbT with pleckstrin-like domain
MDLHPGEQIVFDGHPSWRAILGFYIMGFLVVLLAGVVAGVAAGSTAGAIVVVLALVLILVAGFVKRVSTHYLVTTHRLRIRRGIVARRVQQTQIDRVQNVNTNQSVLERILQVGTVDFDTAGTDDSEFAFRGIANPEDVVAAVDQAQRMAATRS